MSRRRGVLVGLGVHPGFALVVAAALVLGTFQALTLLRPESSSAAAATKNVTALPDLVSARLAARQLGHRVEVTGYETETATTWANPDGTLTTDASTGAVRVRQSDDTFKPVDLNLARQEDGTLAPASSVAASTFSGGGDTALASLAAGSGRKLGLDWISKLPPPEVSGGTATYQVSSTTQLVLTTTGEGFTAHIVLLARPTKAPTYRLPLRLAKLVADQSSDGAISLKDSNGVTRAGARRFTMWDAKRDGGGDPVDIHDVDTTLTTGATGRKQLELSPSMDWLTDPSTEYPVTIDPDLTHNATGTGDTFVYSDQTAAQGSSYRLVVGPVDGTHGHGISYLKWDTGVLSGKHILSATLKLYQYNSTTCSARAFNQHPLSTEFHPSTTTWTTSKPTQNLSGTYATSASWSHGLNGSCANAQDSIDATATVAGWASGALTDWGLSLNVPSANEADPSYEKRFCSMNPDSSHTTCNVSSREPVMSVNWNSYPGTPAGLNDSPTSVGTDGVTYTTSLATTFSSTSSDGDANKTRTTFEISHDPSYTAEGTGTLWTGTSAYVNSGAVAKVTMPAATVPANSYHYRVRSRAFDGTDYSAWTGYKTFVYQTAQPSAPTVSCSNYPSGAWTVGAGAPTCSFASGASHLGGFVYSIDDPNPSSNVLSSTTPKAVTLPTLPNGLHTLYVATINTAYIRSSVVSYGFGVGPGGLTSPVDQAQTQQAVTLSSNGRAAEDGVTYQYRLGTLSTGSWTNIPTADVTAPGTSTHPTWPMTGTSGSFADQAWNVANTVAGVGGADGPLQVQACFFHAGTSDGCSSVVVINLARTSFGNAIATTKLGPGTLSLATGDLSVHQDDVTVGDLTIGRTATTLAPPAASTGATGVFGPSWTASIPTVDVGDGDLQVTDKTASGFVTLTDTDGSVLTYDTTSTGYPYRFTGEEDADDGSVLTKTDATHISLADTDGTVTTWTKANSGVWQVTKVVPANADSTTNADTTLYTFNGSTGLVTEVTTASGGVNCASSPKTTIGCQTMDLTYATATTATGTSTNPTDWGDYSGRLKSVSYTAYDGATSAMRTVATASYSYDSAGYLRAAWDARTPAPLKTTYAYDSNGRITSVTPPGLNASTITYDEAGRVSSVQHADPVNGTATTAVAYQVPITTGAGGPIDLSSATTAGWGQATDLPYAGTAVFTPDHVPSFAGSPSNDYAPSGSDWAYASLTYLDVNGRDVDDASYGAGAWQIAPTRYDTDGNQVWSLTAKDRNEALSPTSDTESSIASLPTSAQRADALATTNTYDADGNNVDSFGPSHGVVLSDDTWVVAREHTHSTFCNSTACGAPDNNGGYEVKTSETKAAYYDDGTGLGDHDEIRTTSYSYDPLVSGDTSGWVLRKPTSTTVVVNNGVDTTTQHRYDADGNEIEVRLPLAAGSGTDAHTTATTYYSAGTNATYPSCGSHPESIGLVCRSGPAAQPGDSASVGTMPVSTYTYNMWGDPLVTTETSGSTARTTTYTYDAADRVSTKVISDNSGAASLPTITTTYGSSTGLPADTSTTVSGVTTAVSKGYDALGRVISYTDATGNISSTSYDIDSRIATRADGKGTTTYTYDGSGEHRGLVTAVDAGISGAPSTFTATYDADGGIKSETYPNGLVSTTSYDDANNVWDLSYTKGSSDWYDFQDSPNVFGQVRWSSSPESWEDYAYDTAGRLVETADAGDFTCVTRDYSFDADSNRTSLTTYGPSSPGGSTCSSAGTPLATTTPTYDDSDRAVSSGYTYDNLGRTLTVPAADTTGSSNLAATYYADDMVHTQNQGGHTKTWTLDPTERLLGSTDSSTGVTQTNVYTDDSDSPAWIAGSAGGWSRSINGPDGNLGLIQTSSGTPQVQLTNPGGDVVATVDDNTSASWSNYYNEDTEFGVSRAVDDALVGATDTGGVSTARYGWLGGKRRSADALGGVILMGVRQFDPSTGRFLSVDPVPGGNANAYEYCVGDPVNCVDLNGELHMPKWAKKIIHKVGYAVKTAFEKVKSFMAAHYADLLEIATLAGCLASPAVAICGILSAASITATYFHDRHEHVSHAGKHAIVSALIAAASMGLGESVTEYADAAKEMGAPLSKKSYYALKLAVSQGDYANSATAHRLGY